MDRQTRRRTDTRTIQVIQVDMSNHYVTGRDQFGTLIQVSWHLNDVVTAIPALDEIWTVERSGNQWFLDKRGDNGTETTSLQELDPGDRRVDTSGNIYLNGENLYLNSSNLYLNNSTSYLNGKRLPKTTTSAISSGPPTSPIDGDIWIATNVDGSGQRWQFQYDGPWVADAYKWKFIGGVGIRGSGGVASVPTTGAQTDVSGFSMPSIQRSGWYRYIFGASIYNAGTFTGAYATVLQMHNGTIFVGNQLELRHHGATWDGASVSTDTEALFAGGTTLNMKAALDRAGSNSTVTNCWIELLPMRIS